MPRLTRPKGSSGRRRPRSLSTRDCPDAPGGVGFNRWADACRQAVTRGADRRTIQHHPECGAFHAPAPAPTEPLGAEVSA
jgi:hypothetical protein